MRFLPKGVEDINNVSRSVEEIGVSWKSVWTRPLGWPGRKSWIVIAGVVGALAVGVWIKRVLDDRYLHPWDEISRRAFEPGEVFRHGMPPIVDIPVVPVQELDPEAIEFSPNSLVLGVTINGESRAYPLNQLVGPQREIFNDTLGGRPIMPTW